MVTRIRKSHSRWFNLARHEDPPADPAPSTDPPGATPPADPPADPAPAPDDLGDAGKKALAAERAARKAAEKAAADAQAKVKEFEDRDKSESEKLAEGKAAAEKAAADARTEVLRLRVMAAEGLDAELEEFLTATDEAGLQAQATKLKERLAAQAPRVPTPDPGQGSKIPPGEVDMRTATKAERDAALRKLGVRRS